MMCVDTCMPRVACCEWCAHGNIHGGAHAINAQGQGAGHGRWAGSGGRWAMGGGPIRCAGGGRWPDSVCCGLAFGGTFTPAQLVMLFDLNFRPHAHVLRPIEHLAPHAVQVFLGIGMALRTQARARVGQRRTWVVAEGARGANAVGRCERFGGANAGVFVAPRAPLAWAASGRLLGPTLSSAEFSRSLYKWRVPAISFRDDQQKALKGLF